MKWEVTVNANEQQPFVNLNDLKNEYSNDILGYSPCIPRYSKLDGKYFNMPNSLPSDGLGYWSKQISDITGLFKNPVEITFKFARPKTSRSIRLVFNKLSGDYCSELHIDWFKNKELIYSNDYYPDNVEYTCAGDIAAWDEVKVKFKKTNRPYRYLFISLFDNYALSKSEGLKIIYNDFAVGAKEIMSSNSIDKAVFCDLGMFKNESNIMPNVGLLLPRYSKLDGKYINVHEPSKDKIPYMSNSISDGRGFFNTNPSVEFNFTEKISSVGITLNFNDYSGDYCDDIVIKWFDGSNQIMIKEFNPNGCTYFCYQQVNFYNKVIIEFKKTSKPFRNVFVTNVIFGVKRIYTDKEIVNCNCFMEISPISDELSINTLDFAVRKENDYNFDFQKRQLIQIYFDKQLYGNFYLQSGKKSNKETHTISSEDCISILDSNYFYGGIYSGDKLSDIVAKIFEGEQLKYYVDDLLVNKLIYGYIPYCSKREALALICFAAGGVVDTSFDERLFIYPLSTNKERNIELSDIYASPELSIDYEDIVTGVNLTVHKYSKIIDEKLKSELFNDVLNGQATITFNEPYHGYSITGGTIVQSGPNYCIINGSGTNITLIGYAYNHETQIISMENQNIFRNKKYVNVEDVTTITPNNASDVLSRLYNYYTKNESIKATILMGRNEIGSVVDINTEFDGIRKGVIKSANLEFTSEVKGDVEIKCL